MQPQTVSRERIWNLPPLILHPFSDSSGPRRLVESSRASLMIHGLLPSGSMNPGELDRRLLDGRYCEIRMIYYVGKDVIRWVEQCLELVAREPRLRDAGIKSQSFAALLVDDPPEVVRSKLRKWGVVDYKHIFSRALGINAIFAEAPLREQLANEFVRSYYRYADQAYTCFMESTPYAPIRGADFVFDLYASGEYSRMLEQEWEADLNG